MDSEAFGVLLVVLTYVGIPLFLILFLGVFIGGMNERAHERDLDKREHALASISVTNLKRPRAASAQSSSMVLGQVVIASDYFKSFATALRNLVGGEMRAAQSLMIRGRREALCRLLEQAQGMGATEVCNVRFGTSNISQMRGKRGAMQVEVIAWGTAVVSDGAPSG